MLRLRVGNTVVTRSVGEFRTEVHCQVFQFLGQNLNYNCRNFIQLREREREQKGSWGGGDVERDCTWNGITYCCRWSCQQPLGRRKWRPSSRSLKNLASVSFIRSLFVRCTDVMLFLFSFFFLSFCECVCLFVGKETTGPVCAMSTALLWTFQAVYNLTFIIPELFTLPQINLNTAVKRFPMKTVRYRWFDQLTLTVFCSLKTC